MSGYQYTHDADPDDPQSPQYGSTTLGSTYRQLIVNLFGPAVFKSALGAHTLADMFEWMFDRINVDGITRTTQEWIDEVATGRTGWRDYDPVIVHMTQQEFAFCRQLALELFELQDSKCVTPLIRTLAAITWYTKERIEIHRIDFMYHHERLKHVKEILNKHNKKVLQ